MVKVEHLMKKNLVSIEYGASISRAAKLMQSRGIGSVLVTLHGRIVGIVTEADIVKKAVAKHRCPEFITVEDIMSCPIIGIDERRPVIDAADLMERHQTRHLAVTQFQHIVGVLSVRDLLRPVAIDEL